MVSYTCEGCGRTVDLSVNSHKLCPAWGTPFYMSGVPYSEQIATFYEILDKDDKEKFFKMLSECCNLYDKYQLRGSQSNTVICDDVMTNDTEWHSDESWCPNCKTYTTQRMKWGGHERDSTHDQAICTICEWHFNGYNGQYEAPYIDI